MAVESTTDRVRPIDSSKKSDSPTDNSGLLPGERVVSELDSNDGGSFRLTHARVVFRGGSESKAIHATAQLKDITSIQISRRPRARRSAAWGVVGLFAAIGVWQVTPNSTVGMFSAIAVAAISLMLMADYWIRPAGVHLEFHMVGGNTISGEVSGKPAVSMQFARDVEDAKRKLVPSRTNAPYRNYPTG